MKHGIKRLLYLTLVVLLASNAFAQDETEQSTAGPSEEIWKTKKDQKEGNSFDQNDLSASKWAPPPRTNVVNTPIDGGILVLLGAGVLYGRKRFVQSKKRPAILPK